MLKMFKIFTINNERESDIKWVITHRKITMAWFQRAKSSQNYRREKDLSQ